MLTFYVLPVGASLYSNIARGAAQSLPSLPTLSALSADEIAADPLLSDALSRFQQLAQARLADATVADAQALCAELNGLLRHRNHEGHAQVLLLPSDTALGKVAAGVLSGYLERQGFTCTTEPISGLIATDDARLGDGLRALAALLADPAVLPTRGTPQTLVVFSLSGGFKAVQGFLQALGTVMADECIYIHETGEGLLRIPALPLTIDVPWNPEAELAVRRDLMGLPPTSQAMASLPASLVDELTIEGERLVGLSAYGKVLLSVEVNARSRRELLPPLGSSVVFDDRFPETCAGLPADRLHQVNHQLARLAAALERGQNPGRSVDLKPLKGRGHPRWSGATSEIDAWHDQDAKRVFGRLDSGVFTAIALDKGLH